MRTVRKDAEMSEINTCLNCGGLNFCVEGGYPLSETTQLDCWVKKNEIEADEQALYDRAEDERDRKIRAGIVQNKEEEMA